MQSSIEQKIKPKVSIVVPAYNEEKIIQKNLIVLCEHMKKAEQQFDWEIIVVNDGSSDGTQKLAEQVASQCKNVIVCNHKVNLYLGHALRTGFRKCTGDYVITLDIDLSYSTDHIERLLEEIIESDADVVIASPYRKGGQVLHVPFLRRVLSKYLNKFLAIACNEPIYTYTSMVRVYKRKFLQNLNLKARDAEINTEIIYKSILLRARITEIPATLDWSFEKTTGRRRSNLKLLRGIMSGLMSGFIFRPYMFFLAIGLLLFAAALYVSAWIFIDTYKIYLAIPSAETIFIRSFSSSLTIVFNEKPHAFFAAGLLLVSSMQFLSLGFLSLQSKRYFEELFHINTTLRKNQLDQ